MQIIKLDRDNILNYQSNYLLEKYNLKRELKYNPFGKIIVLIENNKTLGFLYYSDIYDRIEINQFEVDIKKRGSGLGEYLLTYLLNNNKKNISLEVNEKNYIALNLYKKMGFETKAIRKKYYGKENGILMERVIK